MLICGGANSGKKTFASAFLEVFSKVVFVGKTHLYVSFIDRNAPRMENAEQLVAQAETAEFVTKSMSLEQAFTNQTENFQNELELQLIIDAEFCGRIKLLNILGDYSNVQNEISEYGISMAVVIVDGGDFERRGFSQTKELLEQIQKTQPNNYPFSVLFAVSKADLLGIENTQQSSFYEKCAGFKRLAAFCSENKLPCRFTSFSAAGSSTSAVFGDDGSLVSHPDFRPWNIETVGLYMISGALPILNTQYLHEEEKCLNSIRGNRSIFNSGSFRSEVELQFSRMKLASVIQGKYQLDQYSRHSRQIVEYLRQKVFTV